LAVPFEAIHNEKRLLSKIAKGDRDAFTHFYIHYFPLVQQYIGLFVPDKNELGELTQDVFLKIWNKRVLLGKVESLRGYMFRVCKNHVLNYFRSLRTGRKYVELSASDDNSVAEDAEGLMLYKQYYKLYQEAVGKLSGGRRRILKMSIEQDLSLDEIAVELDITKAGVKKQLYAATAFVRKYLQEHGELSLLLFVFLSLFEA
jgi:RNA polymerase sigma factor (sigma-70 family)